MKQKISLYSKIFLVCAFVLFLSVFLFTRLTPEAPVQTEASIHCAETQTFQCEKRHVETVAKIMGPKAALSDLKEQYAHIPEVVSDCHQLAHAIGNTAADIYGGDISKAFIYGDSFCWSGYYHGVVEQTVDKLGEEKFIENADSLCKDIPGKERYSFDYYNCVHGLGHGLMAVTHNELFKTLTMCDKLTGEWERKSCYGGVFMENIMVDNRNHYAKYLKKDDLMYPCDAVDPRYKEQCYLMQTSYALSQTQYDFANAFRLCAKVDEGFRDTCAQSIGRDASGSTISDPVRTDQYCSDALDDNQRKNCITGAVKDFISYFHNDVMAQRFCTTVPKRFGGDCLQTASAYFSTL